jgi:hypothetical protein
MSPNGVAHSPDGRGRRCPGCGVAGVRYVRSTGELERTPDDTLAWYYVTFCAACGHVSSRVSSP